MSKPKKKKINTSAQQKIQQAQGQNEFKRRINRICSMLPNSNVAWKAIEKHIDALYKMRPQPIRVLLVGDRDPSGFHEYVQTNFMRIVKYRTMPMYENGPQVSLYDYQQLVRPLQLFVKIYSAQFPDLIEPFEPISKEMLTRGVDVIEMMVVRAEAMGLTGSHFLDGFYHVRFVLGDPKKMKVPRDTCTVEVTYSDPVLKHISTGSQKRLAARVGWRFPRKIEWTRVKPSQLGIRNPANDTPMDMYMLKHAANRLYERIGGIYRDKMHMDMFLSFEKLKAFPTGGGNFLIEHRVENTKAGYYAATVTGGVLLIRTFLFLTHTGTPEGKKLTALTGLRKWDQKYLAFDNLLSLANSDILSNEQTCEIFREAGCGGLLTLCDGMRHSDLWEISEERNPIAEKLLQYIQAGKDETADLWADIQDEEPEEPIHLQHDGADV